jgi:hypothetical protein
MNFSKALEELKRGYEIRRQSWLDGARLVLADSKKGFYLQTNRIIGGDWGEDAAIMADDWERVMPNGSVGCECDFGKETPVDDPIGDKILADILKNGFVSHYTKGVTAKMENDIAVEVSQKIAQIWPIIRRPGRRKNR